MNAQKVIEQLGYTAKEAKVYIAALSLGECHISDLAAKLKMPRSSVQSILDTLHKDGLINFYVQRRYRYWVAESPERLLKLLQEREASVSAALPALSDLRKGSSTKTSVKVFAGTDEIRMMYDDILVTRQHILGMVPWDEWQRLLGRGFTEDFIEKRVRHFLSIRLIVPKSAATLALKERDAKESRVTRYAPPGAAIKTALFIYGTKVAIVTLNKRMPTAIVLDDQDIRETFELFFEGLWEQSSE